MATHNLLPQHQNYFPKQVSTAPQWVVRGAAGIGTHGVITGLLPRDRQPARLLLSLFLGIGLSTANAPLLRAAGHGVLVGVATSTFQHFGSGYPQTAF